MYAAGILTFGAMVINTPWANPFLQRIEIGTLASDSGYAWTGKLIDSDLSSHDVFTTAYLCESKSQNPAIIEYLFA